MQTKKFKLRMNRRAVSPVIATLLLIAIAVAASVVTYSWVMSMVANQSAQSQTGIKVDQVLFGQDAGPPVSGNGISITIRNTGSIAVTIQTIYVFQGDKFIVSTDTSAGNVISAGSVTSIGLTDQVAWTTVSLTAGGTEVPEPTTTVTVTDISNGAFTGPLAANAPYLIRIVTSTGFVAEGTYYSPGSFT